MLLRTPQVILLLWTFVINIAANQNEAIDLLSVAKLRQHLFANKDSFFCVLIKDAGNDSKISKMESILQGPGFKKNLLGSVTNSSELSKMTKISERVSLPFLRCFFASPKYVDYSGPSNRTTVSRWIKKMMMKHSKMLSSNVRSIQESIKTNEVTIMVAPLLEQVINTDNIIQEVKSRVKNHCSLSTIFVHPNSKHRRDIITYFNAPQSSSVVIFIKTDANKAEEKTIFSGHSIQSIQINSFILARLSRVKHLTVKDFKFETLTVKSTELFQPYIVGFYAWWAKHAESFLATFKSAINGFKAHSVLAKFALVNVAEEKTVIPAYIQQKTMTSLPFIVVFQRETGKYTVNQTVLINDHPTLFYLCQNLKSIGLVLGNVWGNTWMYSPYEILDFTQYSDIREGPFGIMCTAWAHNQTDSLYIPVEKPLDPVPEQIAKPKTIEDFLPKYKGIPIMTETFWDASVKKSDSSFGLYTSVSKVVITIFAFIRSGCSSCESKMDVFKELHREIGKTENSQFRLVNCSHDVSLCSELSVNGYPSVIAFRNFDALVTPRCSIPYSERSQVRRDYHGPIATWELLLWCNQLTKSSTELLEFTDPTPMSGNDKDVRLTATLVPKTSVYLPVAPNRDRSYFYSLSCFRLACELLYGLASCQLGYSKKVPSVDFKAKSAMVVTEIDFERKDGVSIKIMSLGKPLHNLLEKETSSNLHLFHHPHQYSLSLTQTCESNHDACTQIIVNFTRDHLRLPVTSLTSEIFHTQNNPLFESGKPVLIAMGLPNNITATSSFMQVLYQVASALYKDILVTVMNVEDYPAWAGSFVPKNYNKYYIAEEDSGPLHSYPRLCLVDWKDHSHAAFYPPLYRLMEGIRDTFNVSMEKAQHSPINVEINFDIKDIWNDENLIQYIKHYLKEPSQFIVKTEYF